MQNLIGWGSALIELSQFEKVEDAKKMTRGIISSSVLTYTCTIYVIVSVVNLRLSHLGVCSLLRSLVRFILPETLGL